jgi:hypothetical protein
MSEEPGAELPIDIQDNGGMKPVTTTKQRANCMHLLNVFGYSAILTTYLIATYYGINGKSDADLYQSYPTLLTPNYKSTKLIWGIIFSFQGLFVFAQFLSRYRQHMMLEKGVGLMYFGACLFQLISYVTFAYGLMSTSFVFLFGVFVCLIGLLGRQYQTRRLMEETNSSKDYSNAVIDGNKLQFNPDDGYWLLHFPFAIYAGWIAAILPLMLSITLVSYNVDSDFLVWVAVVGVSLLTGLSMGLLLRKEDGIPSYSFPSVIVYFLCGVRFELEAPCDMILATYDDAYLSLMKNVSAISAVMIMVTIVSRFLAVFLSRCVVVHIKRERRERHDNEYDATLGADYVYVQA